MAVQQCYPQWGFPTNFWVMFMQSRCIYCIDLGFPDIDFQVTNSKYKAENEGEIPANSEVEHSSPLSQKTMKGMGGTISPVNGGHKSSIINFHVFSHDC